MFCRNCGTNLSDGAQFCAKCGQKVENVAQGTGRNTSSNTHYSRPVNSGNYNQNKPKRIPIALIAVAIVLAVIFLLIGIGFISAILLQGNGKAAGQSETEDIYYEDVVQSIQGDWYILDSTWWHFSIEGTSYELYTQDLTTMETTRVQGRIEPYEHTDPTFDDDEPGMAFGKLKFVDSSGTEKIIKYTYPHLMSGSTELKWDGLRLERNDVYGRIKELIQGQWYMTDAYGSHFYLMIEDTEFSLVVFQGSTSSASYGGKLRIENGGEIRLLNDDNTIFVTIYYEYDENTDSIVLKDGETVLEKASEPVQR